MHVEQESSAVFAIKPQTHAGSRKHLHPSPLVRFVVCVAFFCFSQLLLNLLILFKHEPKKTRILLLCLPFLVWASEIRE